MKICIVGSGYVGLSLAVLISQKYSVSLLDIDEKKISLIKKNIPPFTDQQIDEYLKSKNLKLSATTEPKEAYKDSNFIIVATPTNYEPKKGTFDTSSVETVIHQAIKYSPESQIIIKSTVPVGFTNQMRINFNNNKILFSPEFLREGTSLNDCLYPSRIIIGDNTDSAKKFARILADCSNIPFEENTIKFMNSSEAEAVKLFSNTYLAMRVSFFNELDSFSETKKLSTRNVIDGVCSDNRIGNYYNNPSFGYGGYCLPKDTKQLLSNFDNVPNKLIRAIIESNDTRKNFVANSIIKKNPKSVGIYRLVMKTNSDNFRESAVHSIISKIQKENINVYLYEPTISYNFEKMILINNLNEFILRSDIIIANRFSKELEHVVDKVYSRDIFHKN